jgi:hypothetical protein
MRIGIAGKAGSGKTLIAVLIAAELADRAASVTVDSLAAPIKKIAAEHFGWDGKKDERGRRLLQVLGTEAGRQYCEALWISKLYQRALRMNCDFLIVTDVRFENEAAWCRESGGVVHVRGRASDMGEASAHASEAWIEHCDGDFDVRNDEDVTVRDLAEQVGKFAELIRSNAWPRPPEDSDA